MREGGGGLERILSRMHHQLIVQTPVLGSVGLRVILLVIALASTTPAAAHVWIVTTHR